ncbi:uncharacterized protein [Maniola hyperantus]|uniref:uncharacterized protein n=1 Tax=Aphantopus hyperantus TaxID=2795564 RepID=UPI00156956E8|nr:uncharacterized protein LOC117991199 [Maniola hyperantus]
MGIIQYVLVSALFAICASQRSPYAGRRPIGFPTIETTTLVTAAAAAQNDTLGNRFGENSTVTTTTQRLPVEALGDRDLVNRLGQLPQDKQPFWYLNWQALETNRNQPQSYPLKPNSFVDNISFPTSSGVAQNTQQPFQNNQPLQNNQGFPNTQQPLQNNQGFLNTQQPIQSNQGLLNTQQPFQNNQGLLNNQRPFQNNQGFVNNDQQRFRSGDVPEYSDEFDSETF